MQKCVAFFIDKIQSSRYTCSMIKKILALSILFSLGINPSFAVENGEKEKGISRVVALYFGEYPGCSGYLYEPKIVFTAAHCLIGTYQPTHVGLPNQSTGLGADRVKVESILFNDQYNKANQYSNDFAILILSNPIPINNKVILLNDEIKQKIQNAQMQVKISGYGDQDSTGTARETVRDAHYFHGTIVKISDEIEISNTGVAGVCSGDSGGPNTVIYEGQEVYLGATSHGWNQSNCGKWSGGGQKTLAFDPIYKHNSLIEKAKAIIAPETVVQSINPIVVSQDKPTVINKKVKVKVKKKVAIKKKCIKLKNGKCKK
jgi:hypothetical protein